MQNPRNTYIHIQQNIYLHSRHYFTSSNCIFMQLQGIVFIQLQGNDILVNCQGNKSIQITYIIIRGNYICSRNYIHFKELVSSFKDIIFIQGYYIHSRKYLRSRKTYSFREIISIQGNIFISGTYILSSSRPYVHSRIIQRCVRRHSRKIYIKLKLSPATL